MTRCPGNPSGASFFALPDPPCRTSSYWLSTSSKNPSKAGHTPGINNTARTEKTGKRTPVSTLSPVRNRSRFGGRNSYHVSPAMGIGNRNGHPDSVSASPRQCVKQPSATAIPSHPDTESSCASTSGLFSTTHHTTAPQATGSNQSPRASSASNRPNTTTPTTTHGPPNAVPAAVAPPSNRANNNVCERCRWPPFFRSSLGPFVTEYSAAEEFLNSHDSPPVTGPSSLDARAPG